MEDHNEVLCSEDGAHSDLALMSRTCHTGQIEEKDAYAVQLELTLK